MSDKKITDLPSLTNSGVNTTDVMVIVDVPNNITKKIAISELDTRWAGGGGGGGGGFVIYNAQTIASGGTITPTADVQQYLKVVGTAGITTTNVLPFTSNPANGTIIVVQGTDDINQVCIPHNDADYGCINPGGGDIYLKNYSNVTYVFDSIAKRYLAIAGNNI